MAPARLAPRKNAVLLAAIIGLAGARVASTYGTFSETFDEVQHVAAGLDWLGGSYTLWRDQKLPHLIVSPPLGRVAVAAGPWLAGLRLGPWRELPYAPPGYARNLALARAGVLPFMALAILLTWALARRASGDDRVALAAAAILSLCPPFLGHAGLATTDVAFTALALLALLALVRWLDGPTPTRAVLAGAAFGLAFATKLSAPVLGLLALVAALVRRRVTGRSLGLGWGAGARQASLAAGAAAMVMLGAYRFDVGTPRGRADGAVLDEMIDACFTSNTGRSAARALADTTLPAPALFDGMLALCAQNAPGRGTSYLLGRISQDGFPLFFPVALAVKAPLPLLALAVAAIVLLLRRAREHHGETRWELYALPWLAAAFLAAASPSRINIGVRHVLPIFPLLAILAAWALVAASGAPKPMRAAAAVLAAWMLAIPFTAAPDYMAWFNALAGRHPEEVLLESDLDWGQDLLRLERALSERGVERVAIAYWGAADLCRRDLPPGRWLKPHAPIESGWIAISETYRKGVAGFYYRDGEYCDASHFVGSAAPDPTAYSWLDRYQPVARVGTSILLYHLQAERAP